MLKIPSAPDAGFSRAVAKRPASVAYPEARDDTGDAAEDNADGTAHAKKKKRVYKKGGHSKLSSIQALLESFVPEMMATDERRRPGVYSRVSELAAVKALGLGKVEIVSWFKRARQRVARGDVPGGKGAAASATASSAAFLRRSDHGHGSENQTEEEDSNGGSRGEARAEARWFDGLSDNQRAFPRSDPPTSALGLHVPMADARGGGASFGRCVPEPLSRPEPLDHPQPPTRPHLCGIPDPPLALPGPFESQAPYILAALSQPGSLKNSISIPNPVSRIESYEVQSSIPAPWLRPGPFEVPGPASRAGSWEGQSSFPAPSPAASRGGVLGSAAWLPASR
jgi:hypothetical protein